MCPLRLILIFLSATLAGFFVLRNLRSQPQTQTHPTESDPNADEDTQTSSDSANPSLNAPSNSKVRAASESGWLWTFVDMATGRYLWRHLVPSSSKPST